MKYISRLIRITWNIEEDPLRLTDNSDYGTYCRMCLAISQDETEEETLNVTLPTNALIVCHLF